MARPDNPVRVSMLKKIRLGMFGYFAKEWKPDSDKAEVFTRLGLKDKYAAKIAPPSQNWRSIRRFCENLILKKRLSLRLSEN